MLFNLLTSASDSAGTGNSGNPWGMWLMVGLFAVIIVVMMVFNRRSQKKRQEEVAKEHNALRPGNKVKTIGGICGVVVEICPEDNTFVLETGTEASGKSYLKFDMQAIYMSDALASKEEAAKEEEPKAEEAPETQEVFEEAPATEVATETEAPAEEEKKADEE